MKTKLLIAITLMAIVAAFFAGCTLVATDDISDNPLVLDQMSMDNTNQNTNGYTRDLKRYLGNYQSYDNQSRYDNRMNDYNRNDYYRNDYYRNDYNRMNDYNRNDYRTNRNQNRTNGTYINNGRQSTVNRTPVTNLTTGTTTPNTTVTTTPNTTNTPVTNQPTNQTMQSTQSATSTPSTTR